MESKESAFRVRPREKLLTEKIKFSTPERVQKKKKKKKKKERKKKLENRQTKLLKQISIKEKPAVAQSLVANWKRS